MSRGPWIAPDVIRHVKEISDEHPGLFYYEIGKRVGVSDSTVRRVLNNEYQIVGDKVVRIYKKPKKTEPEPEQNMLVPGYDYTKQFLNTLYGSNQIALKDIYDELKQIREILTDLRNMLK